MNFDLILDQARLIANEEYPDTSKHKKCAFINSVTYLVTGVSGAYGGPSIREHLCSYFLAEDGAIISTEEGEGFTLSHSNSRLPSAGYWSIEKAVDFCSPICFGNLSKYALKVVAMEHCFDNDPEDLFLISQWEIAELKELSLKRKQGKLPQKEYLRWQFLKQKHR